MKNIIYITFFGVFIILFSGSLSAQCAVCTKTALQLGEKPAEGLNSAILYLMAAPFVIIAVIGYRWWKGNKKFEEEEFKEN
ncbi:MAG: hypothetical protein WBP16_13215 [Ferruginibacter sp.]